MVQDGVQLGNHKARAKERETKYQGSFRQGALVVFMIAYIRMALFLRSPWTFRMENVFVNGHRVELSPHSLKDSAVRHC